MLNVSSEVASLNNIPREAPFPVDTIIAIGVASPKAHGHAITSTDTKIVSENVNSLVAINQATNEIIARTSTTIVKYFDTISASLWAGALEF